MPARNLIAGLAKEKSLKQRLEDIEGTVRSVRVAGIKAQRLSDIAPDLGIIESGEFRVGNGAQPGAGFTGGRMAWPEMTYGGSSFFLVGVSNDTAQVGLSLDNGKLYAGGGDVILDALGITMNANGGAFIVWKSDTDTNVARQITNIAAGIDTFLLEANGGGNAASARIDLQVKNQGVSRSSVFSIYQNGAEGYAYLYQDQGDFHGLRIGDNSQPGAILDVLGGAKFSASISASNALNVSQTFTAEASRATIQASAFLNLQQSGTLVIASASITAKGSRHRVDGSGAATQTDLEAILGLNDGDIVMLQTVNSARNVKLRHNTTNGNLALNNQADRTLDLTTDMFVGLYDGTASKVVEWGKT